MIARICFCSSMRDTERSMENLIYMNKVLPNASQDCLFTGTPPIQKQPKGYESEDCPGKGHLCQVWPLIDKYTLQDAIDDKVTVPIVYEGRVIPQEAYKPADQ